MSWGRLLGVGAVGIGLLVSGCLEKKDSSAGAGSAADGYPLQTCVVSGEPLDSMGGPVAITYEGQAVKFCCSGCEGDFRAEPAKFLAKIDAAAASHR